MDHPMLSREQRIAMEYSRAAEPLMNIAQAVPHRGLQSAVRGTIDAIGSFGMSEVYARRAERYERLSVHAEAVEPARRSAQRWNESGLATLGQTREVVAELQQEFAEMEAPWTGYELEQMRQQVREELAELEANADDLAQLDQRFESVFETAASRGVPGIFEDAEELARQLDELRRQPDRGAAENLAPWKEAGLAMLVVGFVGLSICRGLQSPSPPCPANLVLVFDGMVIVGIALLVFC
jgi:hypothetical protein